MSKIYKGVIELIGNTPLVEVVNIEKELGLEATLLVKLEYLNPAGSVKDRIAKAMIEDAEKKGILKEGAVIIEPTSGNTGIGLASIAASKGYRAIFTMPETMSVERRNILKAYGAEIVLTEGAKGMPGAIEKAKQLAEEIPGGFIPGQFVNPANPAAHKATTGPEIWNDTDGKVDIFIAGVGTGGTLTGTGEYLKEKKPGVKVVALEPLTVSRESEPDSYRMCSTPECMTKSSPPGLRTLTRRQSCWRRRKASRSEYPRVLPCTARLNLPGDLRTRERQSLPCCLTAATDIIQLPCSRNKIIN